MSHISLSVSHQVATIRIDRPEKKNAMTYRMLGELFDAFEDAESSPDTRAIVFTGVPGAFCAGTDLSDLADTPPAQRGSGGDRSRSAASLFMSSSKPIVAAIDGPAIGMGAEFTSMCDVRIASNRAQFGWVFVHRGLVPDTGAGTWILPRLVGVQEAARLVFSGDIINAERAQEIGYVAAVVEPDELDEAAQREARRFAVGSPFAMSRTKALLYAGLGRGFDDHVAAHRVVLEECFASDDHREGVASFLERRSPSFTGR